MDSGLDLLLGAPSAQPSGLDVLLGAPTPKIAPAGPAPSFGDRFMKGLNDVTTAGGQMLVHALPEGAVNAVNSAAQYVNKLPGIGPVTQALGMVPSTAAQFDQSAKEGEQQYQAARGPNAGVDWARMGGSLLGTAPLAAAEAPAALSKVPALVKALGSGAAYGAVSQPVTNGDYATEKGKQALVGALTGGGTSLALKGAASAVAPKISDDVRTLLDAGVTPTVGQTLGGAAARVEQGATSIPVVGDLIKNAQRRTVDDFNTAAVNRALSPIGDKLPAGVAGRDAIDYTVKALGDRYEAVLPKTSTQMDPQFLTEISSLRNMMGNGSIDPAKAQQFESLLQNQVLSKFQPGSGSAPTITGQTMKQIDTDLRDLASKFGRSQDPDQQMVGQALSEVRTGLRANVARSNPAQAAEIKAIDTGYANLTRVQKAGGYIGSEGGTFTPAQLQSAVRALDPSKNNRQFATGKALMQDLSEAGKNVMGSKVPDSGTPYRSMLAMALLGGGAHGIAPGATSEAAIPLAMVGGAAALPYTKAGQKLASILLTKRPAGADQLAELLRGAAPYAGAIAVPALSQ